MASSVLSIPVPGVTVELPLGEPQHHRPPHQRFIPKPEAKPTIAVEGRLDAWLEAIYRGAAVRGTHSRADLLTMPTPAWRAAPAAPHRAAPALPSSALSAASAPSAVAETPTAAAARAEAPPTEAEDVAAARLQARVRGSFARADVAARRRGPDGGAYRARARQTTLRTRQQQYQRPAAGAHGRPPRPRVETRAASRAAAAAAGRAAAGGGGGTPGAAAGGARLKLGDASHALLAELGRKPHDDAFQHGFARAMGLYKHADPARYKAWPFEAARAPPPLDDDDDLLARRKAWRNLAMVRELAAERPPSEPPTPPPVEEPMEVEEEAPLPRLPGRVGTPFALGERDPLAEQAAPSGAVPMDNEDARGWNHPLERGFWPMRRGVVSRSIDFAWPPLVETYQDVLAGGGLALNTPATQLIGYEVEACCYDVIECAWSSWAVLHRGLRPWAQLGGLLPAQPVRVRVRACNGNGIGEWSEEAQLTSALEPYAPPELVEIDDMPASWYHLDIADLLEADAAADPAAAQPSFDRAAAVGAARAQVVSQLRASRNALKLLFRYYTLAGASGARDADLELMQMGQFLNFFKCARLLDKKFSVSDCDRLYLRCCRALPPASSASAAPAAPGAPGGMPGAPPPPPAVQKAPAKQGKGGGALSQPQWVGSIVRLASLRGGSGGLAERLARLLAPLEEHASAELALLHDGFAERMHTPLMTAVLSRHQAGLRRSFDHFAKADRTQLTSACASTVNISEMIDLCDAAGLIDTTFGTRELIAAFVRVNVDDEIYVQQRRENTSAELILDEFVELLVRVYHGRVWEKLPPPQRPDCIERGLHAWLLEVIATLDKHRKQSRRGTDAGPKRAK